MNTSVLYQNCKYMFIIQLAMEEKMNHVESPIISSYLNVAFIMEYNVLASLCIHIHSSPNATPVTADHSALFVYCLLTLMPRIGVVLGKSSFCFLLDSCNPVGIQSGQLFPLSLDTSVLCFFSPKQQFKQFESKSFWQVRFY